MEQLGSICRRVDETVNPEEDGGFGVFVGLENIQSKLGRVVGKLWCDYSSIKSTKTRFLAGDVLYGKLRPNLNKVWVADTPGICSTDIVVFRTDKDKVSPEYLSHLLRSQRINEKILEGVSGASLPRVSVGYLLSLSVPVPELADQVEISNKMSAKDKAAHYLTKWKGEAVRQMDAYFEKIL